MFNKDLESLLSPSYLARFANTGALDIAVVFPLTLVHYAGWRHYIQNYPASFVSFVTYNALTRAACVHSQASRYENSYDHEDLCFGHPCRLWGLEILVLYWLLSYVSTQYTKTADHVIGSSAHAYKHNTNAWSTSRLYISNVWIVRSDWSSKKITKRNCHPNYIVVC